MKKKTTVIFLAIIMALTIMPLSATAASTTTVSKGLNYFKKMPKGQVTIGMHLNIR